LKSFRSKKGGGGDEPPATGGRNADVDFRGQKRRNDTHASKTDPDAKLYRKGNGQPSQLCYLGHVLMENRNGLCVRASVTQADGYGERSAALDMVDALGSAKRITLAGDKGYDTRDFIERLRDRNVTPHVAQHTTRRRSAIDRRTTRHEGYAVSQRIRKRVEEIFGWGKTIGGLAKTRFRGLARVAAHVLSVMTAYNLIRMARMEPSTA
jgi:IS5 family transposase